MIENTIVCGDALAGLRELESNIFDLCITDPPYFLDKLGMDWNEQLLVSITKNHIGGLPPGMKFDKEQAVKLEKFYSEVSQEVFRILKPGSFFITFSSPRLYHAIAQAIDKSGFEIRDMLVWQHNQGQSKSFKLDHFIENTSYSEEEKVDLIRQLSDWVTPQITPTFEPLCVAQKPKQGTFLENFQHYGVGLMRRSVHLYGTLIESKPSKIEKGNFNDHLSVKPLKVIERLINAFTQENALVLDPFMGSGTTALAAKRTGRRWVGFERESHYCDIANRRLNTKTVDSFFI